MVFTIVKFDEPANRLSVCLYFTVKRDNLIVIKATS